MATNEHEMQSVSETKKRPGKKSRSNDLLDTRLSIGKESKRRVRAMTFAEPVTNVCAGDKNPSRYGYFVRCQHGAALCTDKNGKFWEAGIETLYSGHLKDEQCKTIYKPIWDAHFGA